MTEEMTKKQRLEEERVFSPLKAIRKKCLDCSGGSSNEVRLCPAKNCPLYTYRFGRRPATVERMLAKRAEEKATEYAEKRRKAEQNGENRPK